MRDRAWRRRKRCWQWDIFFWTIHTDLRQATATESLSRKASLCAKHRLSLNTTQAARCRRNACAELRTRFSKRLQIWRRERAENSSAYGKGEEQPGIWTCWRSERWIRVAKTVIRDSNFFGASGGEKERERLCDGHAKTSAQSGARGPGWHWGCRTGTR